MGGNAGLVDWGQGVWVLGTRSLRMVVSAIRRIGCWPLWPLLAGSLFSEKLPRTWVCHQWVTVDFTELSGPLSWAGKCASLSGWDWGVASAATAAISPGPSFACVGPLCQHLVEGVEGDPELQPSLPQPPPSEALPPSLSHCVTSEVPSPKPRLSIGPCLYELSPRGGIWTDVVFSGFLCLASV